jgi:hypothetical protein
MFRVVIRPDGHNPSTKRVKYRVTDVFEAPAIDSGVPVVYYNKNLSILVDKPHKTNTYINPAKALGFSGNSL